VEDITFEWVFDMRVMNPGTFLYNTGPITDLDDPDFNERQYYTVTLITGVGQNATREVLGGNLLMVPDNIGRAPRRTMRRWRRWASATWATASRSSPASATTRSSWMSAPSSTWPACAR